MSYPTIDHRGPEFAVLGLKVIDGIKKNFKTEQPVAIYPSSGTGAWEAALVNTLSPGPFHRQHGVVGMRDFAFVSHETFGAFRCRYACGVGARNLISDL
ncbi:MAG: serine--glyoxylate transaminase [Herbaspirillum sp.]|nr:serine--glyoxylate transaminase [Herbaspirillum sp.]